MLMFTVDDTEPNFMAVPYLCEPYQQVFSVNEELCKYARI